MVGQVSYVIVFPSLFARNKQNSLISNIKKILKLRNQEFESIVKDDGLIVIEANDPVFASSAVNSLFGVKRVAIAKRVSTNFDTLVSEITKIGGNLLLRGDAFLVKAEGKPKGYLPKDLEISTTSAIIEKKANLGAKPGTEEKYDKLLYTYITKSHAYVCIFLDEGNGGIPYKHHPHTVMCSIFDELSAASCIQCIKCGYGVKLIACYTKDKSGLRRLAKTLNHILPLTLQKEVEIEFYQLPQKSLTARNYQRVSESVVRIMLDRAKQDNNIKHVSVPLDPQIFSASYVDAIVQHIRDSNIVPLLPLFGLNEELKKAAKMIGWEKVEDDIEKLEKLKASSLLPSKEISKDVEKGIDSRKVINITVGPNNVHDILDTLEES